jgi:hypothetical protein
MPNNFKPQKWLPVCFLIALLAFGIDFAGGALGKKWLCYFGFFLGMIAISTGILFVFSNLFTNLIKISNKILVFLKNGWLLIKNGFHKD